MADSEYIQEEVSDDEAGDNVNGKAAWETLKKTWAGEDEDGNLEDTINLLRTEKQRRRLLKDTTPLQRGIIRHVILVLDMSFAMTEKDLRPTRHRLTIKYARDFVTEFFEQNPISQLGIVAMRDGVAMRISDMSGNPTEHKEKLEKWTDEDPQGNPSLQNALEMCRALLYNTPAHGTREVLIIYGALLTSDPKDIHTTIDSLIKNHTRVSMIGLAAHVHICAELCKRTNSGDDTCYRVAQDEQHFRELFMALTTPPVTRTKEQSQASLLMMGFPSKTQGAGKTMSFCACHSKLTAGGYLCSRCGTKVCDLPAVCPVCNLTLILSTHLARSYHHLFPLKNYVEVSWDEVKDLACFACTELFPAQAKSKAKEAGGKVRKGVSESGRYACTTCGKHFCIDCDVFAHEVLHNCAGCQSESLERLLGVVEPIIDGDRMDVD